MRSTGSRGAIPLCSVRSHHIRFQWSIIFLDCSQMSCSLHVYPSSGSSENSARISALARSAFFTLWNQLCSTVSNIWRVIVISITSRNCLHSSQAVSFPHGDLAINQDLVGIVNDTVHNSLGNGAAVIRVRINALVLFFRIVLGAEDGYAPVAAHLNNLQQAVGFLRRQAADQPLIQNQQIVLSVAFNQFLQLSACLRQAQFLQQFREPDIPYRLVFSAGRVSKSAGQKGLSAARSAL